MVKSSIKRFVSYDAGKLIRDMLSNKDHFLFSPKKN